MASYWTRITDNRLTRRRALAWGAATGAGLAAGTLIGCGGDAASEGGVTDRSGLITPVQDTTKNAKAGGTFRSFTNLDPLNWDPFQLESASGGLPTDAYLSLVRAKTGHLKPAPLGEVEPNAAESWEIAPDGLAVTLKLQPKGRFDPRAPTNGRAVTSEDVVWSFKRWESIARNRFSLSHKANPDAPLEDVRAIDARTVVVKLAFPDADILKLINALVVEPTEAESKFDPKGEMRGSGPWMRMEYRPSAFGVYERHPYYHAPEDFHIDKIEQFIIPEYATRLAQFRAGAIWDLPVVAADILSTKQDVPELNLYYNPEVSAATYFSPLGWLDGSPFRDIRVRQAMRMAIDGELMAEALFDVDKTKAAGLPIDLYWNSPAASASHYGWWLDPKSKAFGPNARFLEHNPAEAKKLLAAAGFPNGLETPALTQTTAYGSVGLKANDIALAMLPDVGIRPKVQVLPIRPDFEDKVFNGRGKFVGLSFFVRGPADTPQEMANLYLKNGTRYFGFDINGRDPENGDPALADMIRKQKIETDYNRRVEQVFEIQRYLAEKQYYPMIVPAFATSFALGWPAVKNQRVYFGGHRLYRQWIDQTKAPLGKS